jgi:hypothetical protein
VIHPEDQQIFLMGDTGAVPIAEKAHDQSLFWSFPHNAEDIIKTIEKLKGMGFDHIAVSNNTPSNALWRRGIETVRQLSAIPTATVDRLSRATWDEAASLKVWEDVLPYVR